MKRMLKMVVISVTALIISISYYNVLAFKRNMPLLDCEHPERLTIAAVGDILLHLPLQRKASYAGFQSLWSQATPYIQAADIAFANIEGPMAYGVSKTGKLIKDPGHRIDGQVYTSYPLFNYHPKLANALKRSGFDVVATANNHSLDRRSIGVDRTIKVLSNAKLKFTGTKSRGGNEKWYAITESKGFKIAWLACTETTNGIHDKHHQVLYCFKRNDRKTLLSLVKRLSQEVDAVIVTPHWGKQYQHKATQSQINFAKELLNTGAMAVIGTHPHVVQPVQRFRTRDGRNTVIAYSLGNFVSYQGTPKNRSTIILYLNLIRQQGKTIIQNVVYVPAYMENRKGLNKIGLEILQRKDEKSVAYRILSRQLAKQQMLFGNDEFNQYFCAKKQNA